MDTVLVTAFVPHSLFKAVFCARGMVLDRDLSGIEGRFASSGKVGQIYYHLLIRLRFSYAQNSSAAIQPHYIGIIHLNPNYVTPMGLEEQGKLIRV